MTPAGTGGLDDVDPASTIDVDPASTIDTGEIPVTPATTTDTDQVPVDPVTGWPRDRPRRRPARSRRQRIAIHLLIVIVTVLAFVLALGAGWFGDVFGLAMPVVLAASVLVAVAVLVAWRPLSTMPVTLVVLSAFVVFAPRWPHRTPAPVGPVHLAAVNLKFDSEDAVGGVRDALAVDADVLVVSELTPDTDRLLQVQYPYRIVTDDLLRDDRFGEGVYSKLPLTLLATPTAVVGQLLRVSVGGATPFVLYAAHLSRPTFEEPAPAAMISFGGARRAVFALDHAADADGANGPVVIAGDLNLSDRTSGYRRLAAGRLDASRTGWADATFHGSTTWSLMLLRIDHIFVPSRWCAARASSFHLRGSDHDGVQASIGHCPDAGP